MPRIRGWGWRIASPAVVLVCIVLAWWVYARHNASGIFPTPADTAAGFWKALGSGNDWHQTLLSWRSLLIGYGISVPLGTALGFVLATSRTADRVLGIYLDIALVVPMIVVMPIVLIAIGISAEAEVVVIIFFAVPYIVLPIRNGVRAMPALWFDMARSTGISRRQLWHYVLLPGARTPIAEGMRLGLGHAIAGLFTVEFTLVAIGMGSVLIDLNSQFLVGDELGYLLLVLLQMVLVMSLTQLIKRSKKG